MSTRIKSNPEFETAYHKLNQKQRQAVDLVEGPVMVIAGPGTGKTQILAIRIGNILLHTDAHPKNILCLTYTESGASNMRQRLLQFIGPTAYEVTIGTFHSFCNAIIRSNPESFHQYSDYEVVSELEKSQILLKLLEGLTRENILYKYNGNYIYESFNLSKFFEKIKKENWNPERMTQDIQSHLIEMKSDEQFIYKRKQGNFRPGDFKEKAYNEYVQKFARTLSALSLYNSYQSELDKLQRYEYEDMIRWVIEKFQSDEALLARYQEQYQYILVDEYQDTNGAQNEILFQLLSYFESANIFAVGDDDQAIFRFQGANVRNMMDFDLKYNPQKIVLTENYRSSQIILDVADHLIKNNLERLTHKDETLSKKLKSSGIHKEYTLKPIFTEYADQASEILDVCEQVRKLIHQGVAPNEIAILFLKNKDADIYVKWFEFNQIPYQINKQTNVLHEPFIQHVLNIIRYLCKAHQDPFGHDALLYRVLHAPYIALDSMDIAKLSWHVLALKKEDKEKKLKQPELSLLHLLGDEDKLKAASIHNMEQCLLLAHKVNALSKHLFDFTPQVFIEKVFMEFEILHFILNSPDKIQHLQNLQTLFEFIKEECRKNPRMNILACLDLIEEYSKNKITIPNNTSIGSKKGVVLSTLHSAKGLEYDYVFMINNSQQQWQGRNRADYKLIPPYIEEDVNQEEDQRRLFYVGLTRARKGIYVSYFKGQEKKVNIPCRFISEMLDSGFVDFKSHFEDETKLVDLAIMDMSPMKKDYQIIEENLFEKFLSYFSLNPTSLSIYLRCPLSFYYEKVLQIPGARTAPLGFGNAVHEALETFMKHPLHFAQNKFNQILPYFEKAMEDFRSHFTEIEFESYMEEGKAILPGFLFTFSEEWKKAQKRIPEEKIKTEFKGIPISGKLDRIDFVPDGIRVVDYKTGKPDKKKVKAPDETNPYGTDYWQQMIFYAILLRQHSEYKNFKMNSSFYFVNQNKEHAYECIAVEPTGEQIQFMENLIMETYEKIKNKEFTPGCGKPECEWCNYVNSGALIQFKDEEEPESDDME